MYLRHWLVWRSLYIAGQRRQLNLLGAPNKGSTWFVATPKIRTKEATETANYSPPRHDETLKWCYSFAFVVKEKHKLRLCLNPARLNKALIRPIHRDLMLNSIQPILAGLKYLMVKDFSSGYHYFKLDDKWLPIWSSSSGRYVPVGNKWIIQWHAKCLWHGWWHSICMIWWPGQGKQWNAEDGPTVLQIVKA